MLTEKFQKRFSELKTAAESLPFQRNDDGMKGTHVPNGIWQKWGTSAQNLIKAVFGETSPHYQNFTESFNKCTGYESSMRALIGFFESAHEDFEGGYVFNVEVMVSGEVFGDFVVMAKQALSEEQKDVAAVLASAALEDTLKRYASINGLDVTERTMSDIINALKSKGLVSGAQKSLLESMPKFRNAAMHAAWEKISAPEVSGVIGFVEQFLLSNYSHG
jgi:hypothetical protein